VYNSTKKQNFFFIANYFLFYRQLLFSFFTFVSFEICAMYLASAYVYSMQRGKTVISDISGGVSN